MQILAVTPIHVGADELGRRQARYDRLAPSGVEVQLVDVDERAPTALDVEGDMRTSEQAVAARARAFDGTADLLLPDCVLDPAVGIGLDTGPRPVTGVLRLAAGHLDALGQPFGSVTRNAAISAELQRRLADHGLDGRYVGDIVLDLDLDAITDDGRWMQAVVGALDELATRGAAWVINGCSAVDVSPRADGPRLVDPVALALQLLGVSPVHGHAGAAGSPAVASAAGSVAP